MKLKAVYENVADIPAGYEDLFTEKGGKWVFTGVEGIKTQADVDTLQGALTKERNDHKATKAKLTTFGDMDADEVHAKLDRITELEAAAGGKLDETKINEIVEGRIKAKTAPLERELQKAKDALVEKDTAIKNFEVQDIRRKVGDAVRSAATASKVRPEALDDALMLSERMFEIDESGAIVAKDNCGVTPGIDPATWLTEMQTKRPHWWPESQGGGAGGGRGNIGSAANPFSADGWNMTEQGKIYKENPARAENLAKSAGTTVGGQRPSAKK